MSTFSCPVVSFILEKHPNADSLSIARVRGWTCVVRTVDFQNEVLGVYIPLDAVTSKEHPLLSFLEGKRVKTVKLRGVISQGVLLPYSSVLNFLGEESILEETDLSERLGVRKYVPKDVIEKYFGQNPDALPKDEIPEEFTKYTDIEKYNDYSHLLNIIDSDLSLEELSKRWEPDVVRVDQKFEIIRKHDLNDCVCITEKLHGTSGRYGFIDGKFYIGTRNLTLRLNPEKPSLWHIIFQKENLDKKLEWADFWLRDAADYRGVIFYGEIVGKGVQDLHYGHETPTFYLYDVKVVTSNYSFFLNYFDIISLSRCDGVGLKIVPELYVGPFVRKSLELRHGNDIISNSHVREGIVIKPIHERCCNEIGRIVLKFHSEEYLLRKNPKDR